MRHACRRPQDQRHHSLASAAYAGKTTVNLYSHLFTIENVSDIPEGKGYGDYLNTDSVEVIHNAMIEPSLSDAKAEDKFQFVRCGYFVKDMKYPNTYNRIVGLKDSFPKEKK